MKTKLILGTMNPSKLDEMRNYFIGMELDALAPQDVVSGKPDIEESASTMRGNAILKASAWNRLTGLPAMAEDSGLLFLDLPEDHPDQPGVSVRRFKGKSQTDDEMLAHYIEIVHRHGGTLRAAWMNCWCILLDAEHGETYENTSIPFILKDTPSPHRNPGWPLDSISYLPEIGKALVDATEEEMTERNRNDTREESFRLWLHAAATRLIDGSTPYLTYSKS